MDQNKAREFNFDTWSLLDELKTFRKKYWEMLSFTERQALLKADLHVNKFYKRIKG